MKKGALYSALLHLVILLILLFGLYNPFHQDDLNKKSIMVEFVKVVEKSTASQLSPESVEEKEEFKKVEKSKEPKESKKEKPVVLPKPNTKNPETIQPKQYPRALQNLDKKVNETKTDKKTNKSFDDIIQEIESADTKFKGASAAALGETLTASEIDAIRQKIKKCWIIPAGARGAKDLIVDIDMEVTKDGIVKKADLVDKARLNNDPFYRAAAESSIRAVLDPQCNPLPLPKDKYEQWKNHLTLSFNPKDMF